MQVEQLGHYNLLERVGTGGLGTAFRPATRWSGRTVLVKNAGERLGPDPLARDRLLKDAHAAATISHPNVATLLEVGDRPDQLFLVFEFVPGKTLDQVQAGRPLDVRRSVDLGVQLAAALGAAHSQGVLHLDVRPENVRVSLGGHAKLLDHRSVRLDGERAAHRRRVAVGRPRRPRAGGPVSVAGAEARGAARTIGQTSSPWV